MTTEFTMEPTTPANDIPHLTTVDEIQAAIAVPTLVGPPSEASRAASQQPTETRVDSDSTEHALLTLAWAKREQMMRQAEEDFTKVAKKVATELVSMPRTAPWKIGVEVDEVTDALQFTVLVWP